MLSATIPQKYSKTSEIVPAFQSVREKGLNMIDASRAMHVSAD
jgi:hypothetical protein